MTGFRSVRPTRRTVLSSAASFGFASMIAPRVSWGQDGGILKVRSYSDIQVMDPAFRLSAPEGDIMRCIYTGLVDQASGDEWGWKLGAATRIEQVDETHIEFEMRDDLVFTNGYGPMTAEDVKFSIERIADPANESPYKDDWAVLDHVEVTGTHSGVIILKEAFAPLWTSTLPTESCAILSKKAVEEAGGKFNTEIPASCGPYVLAEWLPKQRTVLKRNPEWAGEPGAFEEIHILPIEDEKTAELGFEAGDIDYTWTAVSSLPRLKEKPPPGAVVLEKPSLAYVWLGLNLDVPPLDNPKIRRAIQHAVDREAVVDAAYFGAAATSTGIIAPGLPGHRDANLYNYDPDKARALLDEAGASGLTLTLDILNKTERLTAAQVVQANLADVGITVEIKQNDSGTFWTLGDKNGDYWNKLQLIIGRFSMQPDPSWATAWFTSDQIGVWNWERFNSPEFDALHKQGLVETDPAKRDAIYREAQDLMEESGCYVFLTHEVVGVMHRDTLVPGLMPNGTPVFPDFKPV